MKKVVLVLLVTSVASGATTLHLVRELRAERDTAQSLRARIVELERAELKVSPFASPPQPAEPLRAVETPPPEPAPARSAPAIPRATFAVGPAPFAANVVPANEAREERIRMMRESMERQRALLRDPDYRDAMRTQQKAMLPQMYPDLATELGMTQEEVDRFMTLLADQQLRGMENQESHFFEGPADPAAMEEMHRKAQARQQTTESEIRDLLGEEKYQAWKDYQSTMGIRQQASQLRSTLAMKGAPLGEDQVKPLQRVLAEAERQRTQEWSRNASRMQLQTSSLNPGPLSAATQLQFQEQHLLLQREQNQRLRDSLSSILNAEQLKHFEEHQNAQLKVHEAHIRMMRAQAEAEARGEIPPQSNAFFMGPGVVVTDAPVTGVSRSQ